MRRIAGRDRLKTLIGIETYLIVLDPFGDRVAIGLKPL